MFLSIPQQIFTPSIFFFQVSPTGSSSFCHVCRLVIPFSVSSCSSWMPHYVIFPFAFAFSLLSVPVPPCYVTLYLPFPSLLFSSLPFSSSSPFPFPFPFPSHFSFSYCSGVLRHIILDLLPHSLSPCSASVCRTCPPPLLFPAALLHLFLFPLFLFVYTLLVPSIVVSIPLACSFPPHTTYCLETYI
jgi:hypothetical protein